MASRDVVIDVREEQETARSLTSDNHIHHDGIQMAGSDVDNSTIVANDEEPNGDPPRQGYMARLKASLKQSFWNFLPFAPILITANTIISTADKEYFFWDNFFGLLLFDGAVWIVVMLGWGILYGIGFSIARSSFPQMFSSSDDGKDGGGAEDHTENDESRMSESDRLLP